MEINEESGEEMGYRVVQLNNSSVDLTTVVGSKAESIADIELEEGTYTKIELYSSNIDAEINGSSVDVKIPPKKLMITKPFEVSANETTQFVFDIQVVMRGNERNNQGYILKPVISESGVAGKDVEVEEKTGNMTEENMTEGVMGEEQINQSQESSDNRPSGGSQSDDSETPGNRGSSIGGQRP
jgi:hypothetical protein